MKQGGIEANLGATVWIPLNDDVTLNSTSIKPNYKITDLQELATLLPVTTTSNGLRRGSGTTASSKYLRNRLTASLPDFENGNSNSSDGS